MIVYRSEQQFVPLAKGESYATPTPTPRGFRSRSQISGRTSHDADSINHDSQEALNNLGRMNIVKEGSNGFVQTKKISF